MTVSFIHNNHQIDVVRSITDMYLQVDGVVCDKVEGIFKKDQATTLKGVAKNPDGTEDSVHVKFTPGGLNSISNQLTLYYNDSPVDIKSIL